MEQLDLRLKAKRPALTLASLDVAASAAGITRVFLRRRGGASPQATEGGQIGRLIVRARKELAEYDDIDPRKVYEGLQAAVRDIPQYLAHIHQYVRRLPAA